MCEMWTFTSYEYKKSLEESAKGCNCAGEHLAIFHGVLLISDLLKKKVVSVNLPESKRITFNRKNIDQPGKTGKIY